MNPIFCTLYAYRIGFISQMREIGRGDRSGAASRPRQPSSEKIDPPALLAKSTRGEG